MLEAILRQSYWYFVKWTKKEQIYRAVCPVEILVVEWLEHPTALWTVMGSTFLLLPNVSGFAKNGGKIHASTISLTCNIWIATRSDTVGQTFTFWMSTPNCCKHVCGNYAFFRLSLYALVKPLCNIIQHFRIQLCFSKIWWQSNFMQHHSTSFRIQRSAQKPSLCRIQKSWTVLNGNVVKLNLSFYVDTVGCFWTLICFCCARVNIWCCCYQNQT